MRVSTDVTRRVRFAGTIFFLACPVRQYGDCTRRRVTNEEPFCPRHCRKDWSPCSTIDFSLEQNGRNRRVSPPNNLDNLGKSINTNTSSHFSRTNSISPLFKLVFPLIPSWTYGRRVNKTFNNLRRTVQGRHLIITTPNCYASAPPTDRGGIRLSGDTFTGTNRDEC